MNLNNFWGGDCIEQPETDKANERKSFFTNFWYTNNRNANCVLFGVALVRET